MGAQESVLTRKTLDLYRNQLTRTGHHLEVGAKTCWYLMQANAECLPISYTLVDRNKFNLTTSLRTLKQHGIKNIETVHADVFDLPRTDRHFSSVGMNLVFNKMSGNHTTKMDRLIESLKPFFDRDIVFFGSTLVGEIPLHPMNRMVHPESLMKTDTPEHVEVILDRHFEEYSMRVVGFDPEQRAFGVVWTGTRLRWRRKKVPEEYQQFLWGHKGLCITETREEDFLYPERAKKIEIAETEQQQTIEQPMEAKQIEPGETKEDALTEVQEQERQMAELKKQKRKLPIKEREKETSRVRTRVRIKGR